MPTEIRANQSKTQRLEIPAERLNWTRTAASRSTFAVPFTLFAWVHSKSLKPPGERLPKWHFAVWRGESLMQGLVALR